MPTEQIEKITFKNLIMTIGNLPSSYVESLSYYECMLWLCNYLENTVVPAVNNNGEAVEELQGLYVQLKNYVDNYFNNLDVQEEVNKKLDEMADDGTLTNLIKNYVDPYIDEQNETISQFTDDMETNFNSYKTTINNQMSVLSNQITSATSGSPLVASSTAGMTDTTRVYVNTTDGNWYYYDGDSWEIGGVYQSTGIGEHSITPDKLYINDYTTEQTESIDDNKIATSYLDGYVVEDGIKSVNVAETSSAYRFVYKITDLDNVKTIRFSFPYTSSQLWGRAYQLSDDDGILVNNTDYEDLFGNYASITGATHDFCTYDSGDNVATLDIQGIKVKYPNVKECYIACYTGAGATVNVYSDQLVRYKLQDIKWINSSDYLQKANYKEFCDTYESYSKSDLYNIACFGDSLTANGAGWSSYTDYISNLIDNDNVNVINLGVGGQASGTIAWRQGGNTIKATSGFTLPADSTQSVTVPISTSSGYVDNCGNVAVDLEGTINGIDVIFDINSSAGTAVIKRKVTSANDTSIEANTAILSKQDIYNADTQIIWVGKNDVGTAGNYTVTGVIDNVNAMVNHLNTDVKRFLIIGVTTSTSQTIGTQGYIDITNINTQLNNLYPNNFVDMEYYLVNQCIYDMGITPTEDDLTDISNGTVPRSLLADGVHPTQACREYIGRYIYNVLYSKGWVIK